MVILASFLMPALGAMPWDGIKAYAQAAYADAGIQPPVQIIINSTSHNLIIKDQIPDDSPEIVQLYARTFSDLIQDIQRRFPEIRHIYINLTDKNGAVIYTNMKRINTTITVTKYVEDA
jgi:hypothetical protein